MMIHTVKQVNDTWEVGFYLQMMNAVDRPEMVWHPLDVRETKEGAYHLVNYLNGGNSNGI